MLQAVRQKSSWHVILEDLTDSSLLGTGEHGESIVVDPPSVGQWPRILGLRLPPPLALPDSGACFTLSQERVRPST
jgi:hypothetical protein